MLNKSLFVRLRCAAPRQVIRYSLFVGVICACFPSYSAPVQDYDPAGSVFQMIADLEQEKILLQLEKEKAQLQLDMERLGAEQARIRNEIDAMTGVSNTQTEAMELERQRLELEKEKLEQQKKSLANTDSASAKPKVFASENSSPLNEKYRLVEIVGVGRQLFATIEDFENGQRRKISAGDALDGWNVDSISLDAGVVMSNGNETATLGIISH
jgi:type IV pilus biogenesis protein PilP